MELPQLDPIRAAVARLADLLQPVPTEVLPLETAWGRVAVDGVVSDRDSPALDVSAMDGYALRISDLSSTKWLPVAGTIPAGAPPMKLAAGAAIRVFTGAPVPAGANCVVRREDTQEASDSVRILLEASDVRPGMNIRRRGENIRSGQPILPPGTPLVGATVAAAASFSGPQIRVHRRVRIALLSTGDEVLAPGTPAEPWQIRDSNGPVLQTWLRSHPWVELISSHRLPDRLDQVTEHLQTALAHTDAVLLTGGVSMGDADYVPEAIRRIGGEIAFHRLPLRPGKPVLGAALGGKLILGMPGNPVSVAVTSRVFGEPLLRRLAGITPSMAPRPRVLLADADNKPLDLFWYRLVQFGSDRGSIGLAPNQGSGDLVGLSRSDGFVEIPPGQSGPGPWPLWLW